MSTLIGRIVPWIVSPALAISAYAQNPNERTQPLLMRQPALSATEICFSFAGDLWLTPRTGGVAQRLTASAGDENDCHFSADGRWVAYTGTQDGNSDVYVIAVGGGAPQRLSFHPAEDRARGWTPDGKVLFTSGRVSEVYGSIPPRLFAQAVDGVLPVPVDLPSGWDGSFSADGKRLAYMPIIPANEIWKRYRGGRTTPIWIATLADASLERVPRDSSTDKSPMWVGDTIFFLSDRDGPTTLYSYDLKSKRVRRRVDDKGLDIKSASAGPGGIVYEQFGSIRLLDLASGKDAPVAIRLSGELTQTLPRWVPAANKLTNAALSPGGARAAFEVRGEIITVPAKKGDPRNITQTTAVVERSPSWSPDGLTLAYFSEFGGAGYRLELRDHAGLGQVRAIKLGDDDTYYYAPVWSPDGKSILYNNSRGEIWYVDVAGGKTTRVDVDPFARGAGNLFSGGLGMSWSPDARWIAYGRSIQNRLTAVFIYDVQKGTSTQVTDGMSDAKLPAFDPSGKYLYFLASTDAGPATDFSMTTFDHPVTRNLYAIVLRKDLPSPMAPESDDEKAKADSAKGTKSDSAAKSKAAATAATEPVRIDFDGIEQRTVALPPPPRDYFAASVGKTGVVILAEAPIVPVDLATGEEGFTLHKFELAERKTDRLIDNVNAFEVSRDGEKLLFKQQDKWTIAALDPALSCSRSRDRPRNRSRSRF